MFTHLQDVSQEFSPRRRGTGVGRLRPAAGDVQHVEAFRHESFEDRGFPVRIVTPDPRAFATGFSAPEIPLEPLSFRSGQFRL